MSPIMRRRRGLISAIGNSCLMMWSSNQPSQTGDPGVSRSLPRSGFVQSASHRKRATMGRAEAAGMAIDRHVVGRIGEHHRGTFIAEQDRKRVTIESAAAQDAMPAEDP